MSPTDGADKASESRSSAPDDAAGPVDAHHVDNHRGGLQDPEGDVARSAGHHVTQGKPDIGCRLEGSQSSARGTDQDA